MGSLFKFSIQIQTPHCQKGDSVGMGESHRLGFAASRFWDANQYAGDLFVNALGINVCGRKGWQVRLSRERSQLRWFPNKGFADPTGKLREPFRIVLNWRWGPVFGESGLYTPSPLHWVVTGLGCIGKRQDFWLEFFFKRSKSQRWLTAEGRLLDVLPAAVERSPSWKGI